MQGTPDLWLDPVRGSSGGGVVGSRRPRSSLDPLVKEVVLVREEGAAHSHANYTIVGPVLHARSPSRGQRKGIGGDDRRNADGRGRGVQRGC